MHITPAGMSINQTVVTLTANTDTVLVAKNVNRKYLAIMNISTGLVSLAFDTTAVATSGWPLAEASSLGEQGGAIVFESSAVTFQAVHGISVAGSTVVVLEGI